MVVTLGSILSKCPTSGSDLLNPKIGLAIFKAYLMQLNWKSREIMYSVLFACPSIHFKCLSVLSQLDRLTLDPWPWFLAGGRSWPRLDWYHRSRVLVKGQGQMLIKSRSTASLRLSAYASWLQTHRQKPRTGNDHPLLQMRGYLPLAALGKVSP